MNLDEAQAAAAVVGLVAVEDAAGSWCLLVRPGAALAARGSSWDEAFARLDDALRADAQAPCPECGGAGCLFCHDTARTGAQGE